MLRIRRIPLVTCAAILLLVSSSLETSPGFHRVRALNASAATTPLVPTSLVAHLDAWVAAQPIAAHDDVRPMVLVATSGGGIRAAYWQVLVSNCMFLGANPPNVTVRARPTPVCDPHVHDVAPHPVAIASGISGGSVGVAIALARAPRPVDADEMFRDGWMDPVTGNLLFVDMPNAFLNLPYGRDRARALEDEWIRRAPTMAAGLFATQLARDPDRRFPLVLLSSSSVQDGCRLNVSVLDATRTTPADSCRSVPDSLASTKNGTNQLLGATRDVVDYLSPECGRGDLRLATAALLSARFPIVSPPGGLDVPDTLGASGSCEPPADRAPTYLIDGGFVDASGARPIVDLLPEIRKYLRNRNAARGANEPCIQPVVIQIDNSYADLTRRSAVNRPGGLRSPLTGFLSASGGATDSARQDLANVARDNLEVGCSVAGQESGAVAKASRYIHIHPEAHPGIEAPLGWTLSHASRVDLEQELFTPANVAAIACVRAWLLGGDLAADCSAKAEKLSGAVIPTR